MLISVDFDGTCVTHEFPKLGQDIGAEIVLKALSDAGHRIICTSMRSDKDKEKYNIDTIKDAKEWFNKNNIKLYAFNDNPSQDSWSSSRKIYANIYIDDQFLGCPLTYYHLYSDRLFVDWYRVCLYLNIHKVLTDEETKRLTTELSETYPYIYCHY